MQKIHRSSTLNTPLNHNGHHNGDNDVNQIQSQYKLLSINLTNVQLM